MLAAGAALLLATVTQAAAGGCCPEAYNCLCAPVIDFAPFEAPGGIYLVDQGPVFSGPGPLLPRQLRDPGPFGYPYVGFVFAGYPYGLQNGGGYSRGLYSPLSAILMANPIPMPA